MSCELDCTPSCRLINHGNQLTKCLTKRELREEKLVSFLLLTCANFSRNLDAHGRSALHVACSTSKPLVSEFLLRHGANVQQKDVESFWTPLHRSIHYASLDIVILLKSYGASFDVFDKDFYTPLQLIPQIPRNIPGQKIENFVYVWGKNKNYNLGIGNTTIRNHPDIIAKGLPAVSKASINKYHSLFLTSCSKLFGCGHSKEGRLGVGNDATLTNPEEIEVKLNHKNERILEVSAGLCHSLIRTNKAVYGTGSNKHLQLGIKNIEMSMSFKEIPIDKSEMDLKNMLSINACDYYSVFVSRSGVFVCGLNCGQFGGIQESIAVVRRLPCPVLPNLEVYWANSNNACICIYLQDQKTNYLYIYYNRKVKTYKNPLNEKLKQCVISGGEMLYNSDEIVKNSSQKPLTVTIMTEHNNIYIWYEDLIKFVKVHMSTLFTTQITSLSLCDDQLLIIANGHLFQANIQHKVSKLYQQESEFQKYSNKKDIAEFLCSKMKVKRIQNLANVSEVYCDSNGESFIAILEQISLQVRRPEKENFNFSLLLSDDPFVSKIMDVKFSVNNEVFSANRFVVSSRCSLLKDLIKKTANNGICTIDDERLTPAMFQCILLWIYKNQLFEDDLKAIFGSATDTKAIEKLSIDFLDLIVDWKLRSAFNYVKTCKPFNKFDHKYELLKERPFKWFSMEDFPEFYDLTILLDENQQLRVHKVILMMRYEYFKMMFYHRWSESNQLTIDLRHISISFMRPIVQFAYNNDFEALMNADYSDSYLYKMCAILDQFLMENLKIIFESIIMKRVNLRNCAENLEFSFTYNCNVLRDFCMEFICLNLTRLLEENILDNLDVSILFELSKFYRKYFNFETDSKRIITPAFDAPTDKDIEETIGEFDYLKYSESIQHTMKKTPKSKNKLSKSEIVKRNYEKDGIKILQSDDVQIDPISPNNTIEVVEEIWQKKVEKKENVKRKIFTALKCNEIVKSDEAQSETMVDLTNLRNSSYDEPENNRKSNITLADFGMGIKTKKKSVSEIQPSVGSPEIIKPAWNMNNIELKPQNHDIGVSPFKANQNSKSTKRTSSMSHRQSSFGKNFSSIVREERKEKSNHEKIISKPLNLTQIEEKAIMELSHFYNIDNSFDENINISRKTHKTSLNLSQWQHT